MQIRKGKFQHWILPYRTNTIHLTDDLMTPYDTLCGRRLGADLIHRPGNLSYKKYPRCQTCLMVREKQMQEESPDA